MGTSIMVTSGKGGTGKTSVASGIACPDTICMDAILFFRKFNCRKSSGQKNLRIVNSAVKGKLIRDTIQTFGNES